RSVTRSAGPSWAEALLLGLALWGAGRGVASAQGAAGEPQAYMRKIGFTAAEIASLEAGRVVTRIVPERGGNGAFVAGVVRFRAPAESLVEGIRRIETFRATSPTLQIGRFGPEPSLADIEPLVIDDSELEDLRKCRVGACDIKIGTRAIELA